MTTRISVWCRLGWHQWTTWGAVEERINGTFQSCLCIWCRKVRLRHVPWES